MNPLVAARLAVRDHGGAAAVAPLIGKAASSLCHELDVRVRTAKLGLLDAISIAQVTGDNRIPTAVAAECGGLFLPLPTMPADDPDTNASLEHIGRLSKEFGELVSTTASRIADGAVSDNDLIAIEAEYADLVVAGQRLLAHLRARNLAEKPATNSPALELQP